VIRRRPQAARLRLNTIERLFSRAVSDKMVGRIFSSQLADYNDFSCDADV